MLHGMRYRLISIRFGLIGPVSKEDGLRLAEIIGFERNPKNTQENPKILVLK